MRPPALLPRLLVSGVAVATLGLGGCSYVPAGMLDREPQAAAALSAARSFLRAVPSAALLHGLG